MAKSAYIGDTSSLAKKIKKMYVGDANGVARKVKKAYVGDENGVARLFYSGGYPAGEVVFTSSTTWTAPFTGSVRVFAVGGGGGAAILYNDYYSTQYSAGGGGGGYRTIETVEVTQGESYSVVIGAGGVIRANSNGDGGTGGQSSFANVSANGGKGSIRGNLNGGVGGASGGRGCSSSSGGSNGTDGGHAYNDTMTAIYGGGGGGGGIHTNSFSHDDGYLGGAGGGGKGAQGSISGNDAVAGTANTGGGGGGGGGYTANMVWEHQPASGGSGIVMIRWNNDGQAY